LCEFFHTTPKGLGKLRREDPIGVEFVTMTMIHRWKEKEKAHKKAEKKAKAKRGRKR